MAVVGLAMPRNGTHLVSVISETYRRGHVSDVMVGRGIGNLYMHSTSVYHVQPKKVTMEM